MKLYYVVFALLFTIIGHGQKYTFDVLTKYQSNFATREVTREVYSNSTNGNYFLSIDSNPVDHKKPQRIAYLYDLETMTSKYYLVIEHEIDGEKKSEFAFVSSTNVNYERRLRRAVYDFTEIGTDGDITTVRMTYYKNHKRKKPIESLVLKVRKHDDKLFHIFKMSCMHPFEFRNDIVFPIQGIVESAEGRTISNSIISHKLISYSKVNFQLETTN